MRAPDRGYPAAAENFWLARTEAESGVGRDELDRMAPHVAALSDLFTTERPEGDYPVYFSDPDALNAYGLFFLPQGWMRTSAALAQCMDFRGWRPASADPRVLDVGCGPGHLRGADDQGPGALHGHAGGGGEAGRGRHPRAVEA